MWTQHLTRLNLFICIALDIFYDFHSIKLSIHPIFRPQ